MINKYITFDQIVTFDLTFTTDKNNRYDSKNNQSKSNDPIIEAATCPDGKFLQLRDSFNIIIKQLFSLRLTNQLDEMEESNDDLNDFNQLKKIEKKTA